MTQVAFHFGAGDKVAYVSRLLRKATASGARVLVLSDSRISRALDLALWNVSATDFVTHADVADDARLVTRSSVVLAQDASELAEALPRICVNLGQPVPAMHEEFERIIEVVSTDEEDRQSARLRWKQYTAMGLTIARHDLTLKGAGA